jgi:transcription antitermination factor NusG
VIRVVRSWGHDEPTHVPDEVIDALRARERDGAIDLPNAKRGRKNPRIGDRLRIVSGPFAGHSGLCTQVSRQQVGVLLGTDGLIVATADATGIARRGGGRNAPEPPQLSD